MIHLLLKTKKFIPNEFHNSFFDIDFKKLCDSFGISTTEGLEKFYTRIDFTYNGVSETKFFLKADAYVDYSVSVSYINSNYDSSFVKFTGKSSSDQYKVKKVLGIEYNPLGTNLHHSEDGRSIYVISENFHSLLKHDGAASWLRVQDDFNILHNELIQSGFIE